MKHFPFILFSCIVATGILSCNNNAQPDISAVQDIVIVGGDTLGRNWDDLPTEEEAEQARALGLTPEQFKQLKDEMQQKELEERLAEQNMLENEVGSHEFESYDIPPTNFSDRMHQEKTQTIITPDGREVVVGTRSGN